MTAIQKIHQANLSKWATIFREQAESNLTIREWRTRIFLVLIQFFIVHIGLYHFRLC